MLPPWARLAGVLGSYDMLHAGVVAAAFSADGAYVISAGGDDGTLRVWDVGAQALVRVVPACATAKRHGGALAISGSLAVTGDGDGRLCVRDWTRGAQLHTWTAHATPIKFVAIAGGHVVSYAHQKRVVSEAAIGPILEEEEAGGEARVWTFDGKRLAEHAIGDSDAIALSNDGTALAIVRGAELRVLDPETGRERWRRQLTDCSWTCVHGLGFTGDGTLVGAVGKRIVSIDTSGVHPFAFTGFWPEDGYEFPTLAVSRDGRAFAVHQQGFVLQWDVRDRREVNDGHRGSSHAIGAVYSPDGTRLVTWTSGDLRFWHAGAHEPDPRPAGHQSRITRIAVAANRRVLTISDQDVEARLWDPDARRTLARWEVSGGQGDLSHDGRLGVTIGAGDTAEVRDLERGAVLWRIPGRMRSAALRFSPDGTRLLSQGDEHHELIAVHGARTGKLLAQWGRGAYDGRPVLAITADRVIALDEQRRLARWTLDGKALGADDGERDARDFAIDPAGSFAVTRGETIALHDLAAGTVRTFATGGWYGLAMTAGDEVFASQYDGSVRRYDRDGHDLGAIELGPTHDRATALALSPDGARLYIGTERGVVIAIDLVTMIAPTTIVSPEIATLAPNQSM